MSVITYIKSVFNVPGQTLPVQDMNGVNSYFVQQNNNSIQQQIIQSPSGPQSSLGGLSVHQYQLQQYLGNYQNQLITESIEKARAEKEELLIKIKAFNECTQEILEIIKPSLNNSSLYGGYPYPSTPFVANNIEKLLVILGTKIDVIIKKNKFDNKFLDVINE